MLGKGYILVLLFSIRAVVRGSDVKGGFILLAKGRFLKKSLVRETKADSVMECIQQCLIQGPDCKSINYGVSSLVKGNCQLNNNSAIGCNEVNLVPHRDFIYYERDTGEQSTCTIPMSKPEQVEASCAKFYESGERRDGVYRVDPDDQGAFDVRCDMSTDPGGWTVFQRRFNGSENFYRGWDDYKTGFGNLNGEFWLGLDKIHRMSMTGQISLRVDLEDFDNKTRYAEYGVFFIGDESEKYILTVGNYSGNAGDSLAYHDGMKFSTKDNDNDKWNAGNCATFYDGAWWNNDCHESNLNGLYLLGPTNYCEGINWYHWRGLTYSLKKTEMKIRPPQF